MAASSERDRSGERPARLAEAFHGAPHPGSGGGWLLPPLAADQLGQRELLGGQQRLPVLRRPFLDSLDVTAHALAACHGQRHAGTVRGRDGDAFVSDLGFPVTAVGDHRRPVQHPPDGDLRLPAPRVTAVRSRRGVRFYDAPHCALGELRRLALQEGPEQRGNPRPAAIGLAHGLQAQALPALQDSPVFGADVQVVGVRVTVPVPFRRAQDDLSGELVRVRRIDPLDPGRKQCRVRNAALDAVHERVASTRVAEDHGSGEVGTEPLVTGSGRDIDDARRGGQPPVTEDTLEALALEEDAAIQIGRRIERDP